MDHEDIGAMLDNALEGKSIDLDHLREANGQNDDRAKSKSTERRRRSPSPRRRRRSRSRDRKRDSRDRDSRRRSRSRSPRRRRSRSRDRDSRRRRYSRSPRRGSPSWRRSPPPRSRLPGPERRDVMPFSAQKSPPPGAKMEMTPEERDQRTIFILQLARDTRPEHLEEFFSVIGHVRDVRIITDSKTRRSKGIAYVEFWDREAVPLAMGLAGQRLRGAPLVIQQTCAERNRLANGTVGSAIGFGPTAVGGPLKLCVNNLHQSINEDMLRDVFEPFGRIERCNVEEYSPGNSKGIGYVTFRNADDGKKALEQLNNFDLAGKSIRVTTVDEDPNAAQQRAAVDPAVAQQEAIPDFATQCFMLSNMFDPFAETEPEWDLDVRDDVIMECNAHGGASHVFVDKKSEGGHVYVKCPTIIGAHRSVTALHGRMFAGKIITANYVPTQSYHDLFPEARVATKPLQPRM